MDSDGPMMERRPGVDEAMSRLENEVNDIELKVGNLIDGLHSVLMPEGPEAAPPPMNPNTLPAPPSPVANHLNGMSERLAVLTQAARRARERLDV